MAQKDAGVSSSCLVHISLARWWKRAPSTVMQSPSSLGNIRNAPAMGTNCRGQQLPPAAAAGSEDSCGAKGERTKRRDTGPSQGATATMLISASVHSTLWGGRGGVGRFLPGLAVAPRWETAGKAASGTALSPASKVSPVPRSLLLSAAAPEK